MKRLIDFSVAFVALLILAIPLLFLSSVIKRKLGSPIFFRQTRAGLNGKPFIIIKFRSMTNRTGKDGALLSDAERMTKFGQFLRSSSLDELPGLWNVLRGDLSLVGPRPLLMEYLPLYSREQARRHHVRPGITGWAQINGRNTLSWDDKFKLDVWYVDNRSILLDLRILLWTLKKVVVREGINPANEVTMAPFTGSERKL